MFKCFLLYSLLLLSQCSESNGINDPLLPFDECLLLSNKFNSADGDYTVTTMTKALLYHDGLVKW